MEGDGSSSEEEEDDDDDDDEEEEGDAGVPEQAILTVCEFTGEGAGGAALPHAGRGALAGGARAANGKDEARARAGSMPS